MICFKDITKAYEKPVFSKFNMCIDEGKITAVLGPSGCGKTTLINLMLGFEKADCGVITGTENKRFSVVFQEDRLLEQFTAGQNIMVSGCGSKQCRHVLNILGIEETFNLYPYELSGGMKRRVAIARALLREADIYIFDEPFKGIDQALKCAIIPDIKDYLCGKTAVMITHDINEAEMLSDSIKILGGSPSKIICEVSPEEIDQTFVEKFKAGRR